MRREVREGSRDAWPLFLWEEGVRVRVRVWVGFAAYCLLAGSRWLVDATVPPPLPGMLRVGVHFFVVVVVCLVCWAVTREAIRWRVLGWIGVLAGTIFLLPDAVTEAGSGSLSGLSAALSFTLVPVVVVFAVAQQSFEFGVGDDPRRLLGPALGGVFGAAVLIPFTAPVSVAGKLWLAGLIGSVVLAGLAAVRMHEVLRRVPLIGAAAVASGVMAVAGLALGHGDWSVLGALIRIGGRWRSREGLRLGSMGRCCCWGFGCCGRAGSAGGGDAVSAGAAGDHWGELFSDAWQDELDDDGGGRVDAGERGVAAAGVS